MLTLNFRKQTWRLFRPNKQPKGWNQKEYGECHKKRNGDIDLRVLSRFQLEKFRDKKTLDQFEIETLIHETLHGMQWDLSEEAVIEFSELIAELLYKSGYRYCE